MIKFNKNFNSNIDKFLQDFDYQHPEKSFSQQQEIKKYSRITELRDIPVSQSTTGKIWEQF